MYLLRASVAGLIGYTLWILLGRRLLHDPTVSARRFAISFSAALGIVHLVIALVGAPLSNDMITVAAILTIAPIIVGYPVAIYLYHHYRRTLSR